MLAMLRGDTCLSGFSITLDTEPPVQHALKRLVEPFVLGQPLKPWSRARQPAPLRLQGPAVGKPMQHVKLAAFIGIDFEKLEALPIRALEQDFRMLALVPSAKFRTPFFRRP